MSAAATERAARTELRRALLAEGRAIRLGQTLDRRANALHALRRAGEMGPSEELTREAVATLALPERRLEASLSLGRDVRCYTLSPDLRQVALGQRDGEIVLRQLADGTDTLRLRPEPRLVSTNQYPAVLLTFSPDGLRLSARYQRGALAVWDLATGALLFTRDTDALRREAGPGLFSSNGRNLVAPTFSPDGFGVFDIHSGNLVAHFPEVGSFHHAAVRPGTNQFAAYDGRDVLLLDWETRRRVRTIPVSFGAYRLIWSPDGKRLGIGGNSLEFQIHEVETGDVTRLRGHRDAIHWAEFDPTGHRLAAASSDGISRIWNLSDGRLLNVSTDARFLSWGPEDRTGWLMPGRRLEIWRSLPGTGYFQAPAPDLETDPLQLDVSPDGQWAVSVSTRHDALICWPLALPGPPQVEPLPKVQAATFEPTTGRLLVIRDQGLETFVPTVTQVGGLSRLLLGVPEVSMPIPARQIDRVTCSLDGNTRAFIHLKGGATWLQNQARPKSIVSPEGTLHSSVALHGGSASGTATLALSPDGKWLVTGADLSGVCVFDAQTGKRLKTLESRFAGVQFSHDGRWLVANGPPACAVFRTADWTEAWRKPHHAYIYQAHGSAAFAPDGSQLAYVTAPSVIVLAEVASGNEIARLESPSGSPPITLRWAQADQLVATTRQLTLDVWHPRTLLRAVAELSPKPATSVSGLPPNTGDGPSAGTAYGIGLAILVTAGVVSVVALRSVRRYRRLIEEHAHTEMVASQRARELEIEREVGRLKSSFVAMVSHEFRTPLGVILSAADLLENYADRLPKEKRAELLGDIQRSTKHMGDLMEKVLLLGRAEAGKLGFKPVSLDLKSLLERWVDQTASATHGRCPITVRLGANLDGACGDESLIAHIVGNLLANAVKYSPPGRPVDVSVKREAMEAVCRIRDRGIGIPATDIPRLFDGFHRGGNVGDIPGTGLGLVIVKRCVELHGGTISLTSEAGSGTEFIVRLPVFQSAGRHEDSAT